MKTFLAIVLLLAGCTTTPTSGWIRCTDYTGQPVYEGRYHNRGWNADVLWIEVQAQSRTQTYWFNNACCVFSDRPITEAQ